MDTSAANQHPGMVEVGAVLATIPPLEHAA